MDAFQGKFEQSFANMTAGIVKKEAAGGAAGCSGIDNAIEEDEDSEDEGPMSP